MKEVPSHSPACSLSLFQPHRPVFTPFLSNSAPPSGRVAIPAMRSPADTLTQRGLSIFPCCSTFCDRPCNYCRARADLSTFHNLFTLGRKEREGCALTFFRSPE